MLLRVCHERLLSTFSTRRPRKLLVLIHFDPKPRAPTLTLRLNHPIDRVPSRLELPQVRRDILELAALPPLAARIDAHLLRASLRMEAAFDVKSIPWPGRDGRIESDQTSGRWSESSGTIERLE